MQQHLDYLRSHWKYINKAELARFLGVSKGNLWDMIKEAKHPNGTSYKLPERLFPKLIEYFEFMNIKL